MHALLLHNIRSAHNVGSLFRTADAAGITRIFLSGYTPAPLDRFGRPQKEIAKTALGAEKTLPWEWHRNPATVIRRCTKDGFVIAAVEQAPGARDYRKFRADAPTLYVFGNEVRGLSKSMLSRADVILEIPMRGKKESLNVSVAAGIVLFATQ